MNADEPHEGKPMSTAEPTPGPWYAFRHGADRSVMGRFRSDPQGFWIWTTVASVPPQKDGSEDANMAAIAALPDFRALAAQVLLLVDCGCHPTPGAPTIADLKRAAAAAIAKASDVSSHGGPTP